MSASGKSARPRKPLEAPPYFFRFLYFQLFLPISESYRALQRKKNAAVFCNPLPAQSPIPFPSFPWAVAVALVNSISIDGDNFGAIGIALPFARVRIRAVAHIADIVLLAAAG